MGKLTEEQIMSQAMAIAGRKGGPARARSLTPERRQEIARNAVLARWAKKRKEEQDAEPVPPAG